MLMAGWQGYLCSPRTSVCPLAAARLILDEIVLAAAAANVLGDRYESARAERGFRDPLGGAALPKIALLSPRSELLLPFKADRFLLRATRIGVQNSANSEAPCALWRDAAHDGRRRAGGSAGRPR